MKHVVFVFGSNLAGRHGKGAARDAVEHWGAKYGTGEGFTGSAYAIPTKDEKLNVLPLERIRESVKTLIKEARTNKKILFYVTPFGTGLAGYSVPQIKELFGDFSKLPLNLLFTKDWLT